MGRLIKEALYSGRVEDKGYSGPTNGQTLAITNSLNQGPTDLIDYNSSWGRAPQRIKKIDPYGTRALELMIEMHQL